MRMRAAAVTALIVGALTGCSATPEPGALTEEQAEYVAAVEELDTHLSTNAAATAQIGERICSELASGASAADVVARSQRITGSEVTIGAAQATQLVDAAREHLCR